MAFHLLWNPQLSIHMGQDYIKSPVTKWKKRKWMIKTRRADGSQTQCIIHVYFNNSKLCSSPSSCTSDQAIWSVHNSPRLCILTDLDLGGNHILKLFLWSFCETYFQFIKAFMKWGRWRMKLIPTHFWQVMWNFKQKINSPWNYYTSLM